MTRIASGVAGLRVGALKALSASAAIGFGTYQGFVQTSAALRITDGRVEPVLPGCAAT